MSDAAQPATILERILSAGAPLALRRAAARGALPLPRAELVQLYVRLRQDPDEEVRRAAQASLEAAGSGAIQEALDDPDCAPDVLVALAGFCVRDEALAERLAFHPNAPAEALAVLASSTSASVLDLVLTNEQKLLSAPSLLDRLSANPALRPDQRVRILDLLDRFFSSKERPEPEEPPGTVRTEAPAGEDAAAVARLLDVDVGELVSSSEILGAEELEQAEDPAIRSAYRKILTLNAAQKALLAMRGGREERMILIRDTNRVVALAVLRNPRLTEQDVTAFASMRNVNEEVLRAIGASREWSKSYAIVSNLVRNPRTPPGISTNFIPRLVARDLKLLMNDKNVPELVRRNAKRTYEMRMQKTEPVTAKRKR
jgi:hypothetical protein